MRNCSEWRLRHNERIKNFFYPDIIYPPSQYPAIVPYCAMPNYWSVMDYNIDDLLDKHFKNEVNKMILIKEGYYPQRILTNKEDPLSYSEIDNIKKNYNSDYNSYMKNRNINRNMNNYNRRSINNKSEDGYINKLNDATNYGLSNNNYFASNPNSNSFLHKLQEVNKYFEESQERIKKYNEEEKIRNEESKLQGGMNKVERFFKEDDLRDKMNKDYNSNKDSNDRLSNNSNSSKRKYASEYIDKFKTGNNDRNSNDNNNDDSGSDNNNRVDDLENMSSDANSGDSGNSRNSINKINNPANSGHAAFFSCDISINKTIHKEKSNYNNYNNYGNYTYYSNNSNIGNFPLKINSSLSNMNKNMIHNSTNTYINNEIDNRYNSKVDVFNNMYNGKSYFLNTGNSVISSYKLKK